MIAMRWTALLGWAAIVLWLSSLPPQEMPDPALLIWDKLSHFLFYALGGWLAGQAIRASRPRAGAVGIVVPAVILVGAFGVLDETFQTFTPGRSGGNLPDWIADVLGATAGALLAVPALRRARRAPTDAPPIRERSSGPVNDRRGPAR